MLAIVDNIFPWLGAMLDMGGNILLLIIVLAALMWAIFAERLWFINYLYPRQRDWSCQAWKVTDDKRSWYSQQIRQYLLLQSRQNLNRYLSTVRALIKLCPLLGLLGTVLGMLEVFDAIAITGSNSPRSTASGVSKAIFTTMAGMVIAISGLPVVAYLGRKAEIENEKLKALLKF